MADWKISKLSTYLTNQSGVGSFQGTWVACFIGELAIWEVWWSAFAGTAGSLALQGTQDQQAVPSASRIITLPALTSGVYGAWPTVGATAGNAVAMIKSPFSRMRLTYTSSGPGTVNQFQATLELRT